jgi:hypothetical protein
MMPNNAFLDKVLFILSKEDFEIVVDFLFYSAMASYQDLLQREILGKYRMSYVVASYLISAMLIIDFFSPEKCVIDLLTTYGYKVTRLFYNQKILNGLCHEINNFFEGLKNKISTFCTCADGFTFFCCLVMEKI